MVASIGKGGITMGNIEVSRSIIVILINTVSVGRVGMWDIGVGGI